MCLACNHPASVLPSEFRSDAAGVSESVALPVTLGLLIELDLDLSHGDSQMQEDPHSEPRCGPPNVMKTLKNQNHRSLTLAARNEGVTEPRP